MIIYSSWPHFSFIKYLLKYIDNINVFLYGNWHIIMYTVVEFYNNHLKIVYNFFFIKLLYNISNNDIQQEKL